MLKKLFICITTNRLFINRKINLNSFIQNTIKHFKKYKKKKEIIFIIII